MRAVKTVLFSLIIFFCLIPQAFAYSEVAKYTAPNGFQVISYSQSWANEQKLKGLYDELLNNVHGKEMELLSKIYIYPAASLDGNQLMGQWYGYWRLNNGHYELMPNRYINLYHGDKVTDVQGYAKTLAHEYGHHFTYYYYFKKENIPWEQWRNSEYAKVRGIESNAYIGSGSTTNHPWLIYEIAAEDYVQLFGSASAKKSEVFYDIEQRVKMKKNDYTFNGDIYNLCPQENLMLSLPANKEVRSYWLNAVDDIDVSFDEFPKSSILRLEHVKDIGIEAKQYVFTWSPGFEKNLSDESDLEYTLVRFTCTKPGSDIMAAPVKTVYSGSDLTAKYGAVNFGNSYYWEIINKEVQFFTVFTKNQQGYIVSSNYLAVDFSIPENPDYISISPWEMNAGEYFKSRVKVNGQQLQFDVNPVNLNGRIMVPVRKIFEQLSAEVVWNGDDRTVSAFKEGISIKLKVGETEALVNEKVKTLDSAAIIKDGRTLVPLRFVSEALGAEVNWNQNLKLVTINN